MSFRLSLIPKSRLYLILIGLLINSIIFSASFTLFTSFNSFSDNFLGKSDDIIVIYNPLANTVFTGSVPTYISSLLEETHGVVSSPEVLAATISLKGEIITVRGVSQTFYEMQTFERIEGETKPGFKECIIGVRVYQRISKEIGEYITLRSTQSQTLHSLRIVGVYKTNSPLDNEIIAPIEYVRSINGFPAESSTLIRVRVGEGINEDSIRKIVTKNHTLLVKLTSEFSFQGRLYVKTQSGRVIETHQFNAPEMLNLSLPFGKYLLQVEDIVEVVSLDEDENVEFHLYNKENRLKLRVLNGTSGVIIPANVTIKNVSTGYVEFNQLNDSDFLEILLPDGEYIITASVDDHLVYRTIHVFDDLDLDVLIGEIPLKVDVYDTSYHPVCNSSINVVGDGFNMTAFSDDLGSAKMYLKEGEYIITVSKGEFSESLQIYHNKMNAIIFTLGDKEPRHNLAVRVSWSNGTLVNGSLISIKSEDFFWSGYTDYAGKATIHNVPKGRFEVNTEKNGKRTLVSYDLIKDGELDLILPVSISFDETKLSPEWVRYLPQSVKITMSDSVFKNSMRVLVSLMTSTLFILAFIFTLTTMTNSLDIIQNSLNESSQSLGVLRAIGATKMKAAQVIGGRLFITSIFVGIIGYIIGYSLVALAARFGLVSLAGYVLEPEISSTLLVTSMILCPLTTLGAMYFRLGSLLREPPMMLLRGLRRSDILYFPKRIVYPFLAFVVPFVVRSVPEILVYPYSIGYDTISSYIPALVAIQTGFENQVFDFLYQRPFFWVIASLPYPFDGLTPFKFLPVLLHGLLGVSIYIYAEKATRDKIKAIAISMLSTLYFIPLRVSWDLYGNEMGLILVFLSLTILNQGVDSWGRRVLAFMFVTATVLTHEAASMILFFCSLPSVIKVVKEGKIRNVLGILLVLVPPLLFFLYRLSILNFPLLGSPVSFRYPSQTYESLFRSVSTLYLYAVLPLLPLAFFGFRSMKRSMAMMYWFLGASFAALSPVFSPDKAIAFWDRWVYMTTYPLCFYAIEGINALNDVKIMYNIDRVRITHLGKVVGVIMAILVLFISSSFIASTPGKYQPYQILYGKESAWIVRFVPSSMLLSTVPPAWAEESIRNIEWLNSNVSEVSVLFVDEEIRGYAAFYINREMLLLRDLGDPWYSNPNYRDDAYGAAKSMANYGYDVYVIARNLNLSNMEVIKRGSYLSVYRFIST